MNQMLDAALRYADRGWKVFPLYGVDGEQCECHTACGSPGKHPRTPHGVKDATDDPEQIVQWWERWPNANIGVATGEESGLYVIDVDNRHSVSIGGGALLGAGDHSLRQAAMDLGDLPDTLVATTGGGGRHYLFAYPPGGRHGNRAAVLDSVDIRGDGGYIVAAPSRHISGFSYAWLDPAAPLADLPPGWTERLELVPGGTSGSLALELEPGLTIHAGEGRHDWLFRMGSKLRGQHALPQVALYGALMAYNRQVLVPPLEPKEVEHIVDSCMQYEPFVAQAVEVEPRDATLEEGMDLAWVLTDFLANEPPPFVPLIGGLLHKGEGMILGGQPNLGKTWIVMDMMLGVASGTTFANHFACTSGPVLFIDEEGSPRGDWQRFQSLLAGRERSGVNLPIFGKIGGGIRVDDVRGNAAIRRLLERYHPSLVVLDSLVRLHGGEESSNKEMAAFFRLSQDLMRTYECSFLFTHHIRKPPKDGESDPFWILRGASDIQGWPDSIIVLTPGDQSTEIRCHHTKMRNAPKQTPFTLNLIVDDQAMETKVGYLGAIEHGGIGNDYGKIVARLREMPIDKRTRAGLATTLGISPRTIQTYVQAMLESGMLVESDMRQGSSKIKVLEPV